MSFAAQSPTIGISTTATSKSLALVSCRKARLVNTSNTIIVYFQFGAGSATAVIPTADNATGTDCVVVPPLQSAIVDVPYGSTHVAAIGSAAGPTLAYITPGAERDGRNS